MYEFKKALQKVLTITEGVKVGTNLELVAWILGFAIRNKRKSKLFKNLNFNFQRPHLSFLASILPACGSKMVSEPDKEFNIGFSLDYTAPSSNFEEPQGKDIYFKIMEPTFVSPYWISALEMDNGNTVIAQILSENDQSMTFSFPLTKPQYLPVTILGWAPATENMMVASREIFSKLEKIIDIRIEESEIAVGLNNFAISQSTQASTSGFGYFPNNYYELGSDIFISKEYSNPLNFKDGSTNYNYEVLLHEIGHALGLKHPFEGAGENQTTLNTYEDQTKFTAMSYDTDQSTFSGSFRDLDFMTLTKFYGVSASFRPNDDIYKFNDHNGVFIIDGGGQDSISMPESTENIFIDLRPGTHSHLGEKSTFITAAKQLTISHGSEIENVKTGFGNDTVIGNSHANTIMSGSGNDIIFAGEGADVIYGGIGNDIIDLSENDQTSDIIVLEQENDGEYFETLYGFAQGISGDIIDITKFNLPNLTALPMVDIVNVPSGYIDNCLVTVFGEGLSYNDDLALYFEEGNIFENFQLSDQKQAILITSGSQRTGEDQNIFSLEKTTNTVEVHHLAYLVGNYLDIDNWSTENFLI